MKSSLEALEGNKVKLYVEVEEDEFEHDIDRAFRAIAKEISLPGFRAGKVPRKVLEARVGLGRPVNRRCATPSRSIWPVRYASTTST